MSERGQQEDLQDRLIDALLLATTGRERAEVETGIGQVLRLIEAGLDDPPNAVPLPESATADVAGLPRRLSGRVSRLVPWSIAATVVLALAISYQGCSPDRMARAAVTQSLVAAAQPVPRHYRLTVTRREASGRSSESANDLYVLGNDQVALRHPLAGRRAGLDLWLGKSADRAWVVPAFGPVFRGDGSALGKWLEASTEVDTPYLHVTTVLDRMRRGYRLREREQGTVDGQPASLANPHCRRLTGTRRWLAQTSLPATIELWTDVSTGMARRIELRWQPGTDPRNRERVLVEWIGEEPLPDDWFEAEGHYSGERRVLDLSDRRALARNLEEPTPDLDTRAREDETDN
jgi:hypothetical protein